MRYYKWSVDEFHMLWNPENCQIIIMELDEQKRHYELLHLLKRKREE